ncbi:UDP-2,4-diacetamido-2,4,6-trideoxy-beta-L-altropyranose hydrolase [Aureimonas populi]|uniref:UDP-2,4-diacetamido-2,4, 6-trideoxy-beta-L-altropyranose hydrolase n=1 Tax=Aureimonas populi TaxID=1701758 RepID=A0ABW5CPR4_9HYPH|nr:UDP-2,4-diacetamido-2,4,6-trideoxy-beta-L-altropyranose hydrolase [Aureimonas populi]
MSGALPGVPLVAFRADGSVRIGTGHVMRCLTLADALAQRGIACLFVARTIGEGLAERVERSGHRLLRLAGDGPAADGAPYGEWLGTSEAHDVRATAEALAGTSPLAIVVDHYALGEAWERELQAAFGAPLLALDDLSRPHAAHVLVDPTFGKDDASYDGLLPEGARRLVGASYALLRPDFARLRAGSLARRDLAFSQGEPARDVLVSMGGADEQDATGWVLEGLEPLARARGLRLHALVGAAYPHGERLHSRAARLGGLLEIHHDVWDMAEFLSRMDLAVGAAGGSAWERCCLGLPTVNLVLADNQRTIALMLSQAGAAKDGGAFEPAADPAAWAARHVEPLLAAGALGPVSERARLVADGHGVQRVLSALLADGVRALPFALRKARMEDAALLYEWQCDPRTRRYAVNPAVPAWEEHEAFMARKLADAASSFYVATAGGIACGVVRLDRSGAEAPPLAAGMAWREVSILTAPEFYGCGVASRALTSLKAAHGGEAIVARVLPGNEASRRLFAGAGFATYAPDLLVWSDSRRPDAGNGSK